MESSAPQGTVLTWEDLRAAVVSHHGVLRMEMGGLRELGGYGRLGVNARHMLSGKLAGVGIGHLPMELPAHQHEGVLLYQHGTPAADVIAAITRGVTGNAESALIRLNSSHDLQRLHEATFRAAELLTVLSDRCRDCQGPLA